MRTLVKEGVDDGSAPPGESESAPWTSFLAPLTPFAVAGIVVVGIALRFFTTSKLWLDEALSANIASLPVGDLLVTDALRGPTGRRLAAIWLVSGLLLLTHYWSFYLLGAAGLLLALRWWRSPAERAATGRVLVAI